jgi:thiamine-monophosphate kinase
MKLSELGEFGLIELLAKIAGGVQDRQATPWQQLLVGIGDDAAAWQPDARVELATTDSLIQGVHFNLETTTWQELGWKSLAIGLSDIAAMGGTPRYALVSISLPRDTRVEDVSELYRGMVELGQQFGVAIVGGDTSSAPLVILNTTIFGSALGQTKKLLTRSAVRAGEKIAVTGYLGGAAAGLEMLTRNIKLNRQDNDTLRRAFLKPNPRVAEGQILVQQGVEAAIDISDGLISDLSHICQASGVGARLEVNLVPIHPTVKKNFKDKSLEMALSGGEDYELLFTASNEVIERVRKAVKCPVTVIGEITADKMSRVILIDKQGKPYKPARTGWQHFTNKS